MAGLIHFSLHLWPHIPWAEFCGTLSALAGAWLDAAHRFKIFCSRMANRLLIWARQPRSEASGYVNHCNLTLHPGIMLVAVLIIGLDKPWNVYLVVVWSPPPKNAFACLFTKSVLALGIMHSRENKVCCQLKMEYFSELKNSPTEVSAYVEEFWTTR